MRSIVKLRGWIAAGLLAVCLAIAAAMALDFAAGSGGEAEQLADAGGTSLGAGVDGEAIGQKDAAPAATAARPSNHRNPPVRSTTHVRAPQAHAPIRWRRSTAVGTPGAGRLVNGVRLPQEGRNWVSWDPIVKRRPSREWRRWGTDGLIGTILEVMRAYGNRFPNAPRVAIGDLSRPEGGDFGPRFGFIGHATHQNGLDADIYYPRIDERVRPPDSPDQVDVRRSQWLVDRFLDAGAETIYVGPSLPLQGPAGVVPLANHDNHMHVRLPGD